MTDFFYLVHRSLRSTDLAYKAVCAKPNQCDTIVTRNKKEFSSFGITLLSPDELLEKIA